MANPLSKNVTSIKNLSSTHINTRIIKKLFHLIHIFSRIFEQLNEWLSYNHKSSIKTFHQIRILVYKKCHLLLLNPCITSLISIIHQTKQLVSVHWIIRINPLQETNVYYFDCLHCSVVRVELLSFLVRKEQYVAW